MRAIIKLTLLLGVCGIVGLLIPRLALAQEAGDTVEINITCKDDSGAVRCEIRLNAGLRAEEAQALRGVKDKTDHMRTELTPGESAVVPMREIVTLAGLAMVMERVLDEVGIPEETVLAVLAVKLGEVEHRFEYHREPTSRRMVPTRVEASGIQVTLDDGTAYRRTE